MMSKEELVSHYYIQHRQELLAYVAKGMANSAFSEDVLQNVFLKLLQSDKMITPVTLPALVYTVARNLVSDYWRHRAHVNNYRYLYGALWANGHYDAESDYSARELIDIIERGVTDLLPEKSKVVYRLNVIEGLKVSEISTLLDRPYKTVENQLGNARKQMREYIKSVV